MGPCQKLVGKQRTTHFGKVRVGKRGGSGVQDIALDKEEPVVYDPTVWLEDGSGPLRQPMQWTLPPTDCPLVEPHPWAHHLISLLIAKNFLPAKAAATLELTVWSDRSGINCEMFALKDLGAAMFSLMKLQVVWNLYFTCEQDETCLEFAKLNHKARHCSNDMEERCFKTGKFRCKSCQAFHEMPTSGVDIYIATFPCTPWCRRGNRSASENWNNLMPKASSSELTPLFI